MKFSVVIAAYNASSTICATLQSCVGQSFVPFEIIVVDDASSDNTLAIVHEFSAAIKVISFKENKGVSAARNAGWNAASGDYVAFLDSDDFWHLEKLFWVSEGLKNSPETFFLAHQFSTNRAILNQHFEFSNKREIGFWSLLLANQIQGSCIIIKKNVQQRFDESMHYCEDYDLALRCAYQQTILFLETPLNILSRPQQSEGGLSANKWKMRLGELYLFTKLAKLNPLLIVLIPFLWLYSLGKHFIRKLK